MSTRKNFINGLINLPSPSNITFFWNFGSLLGVCLIIQIVTGLFLSIHFTNDIELAFSRISHITRDVNHGWLIRSIHSNGASLFFILVFIHIRRGIYYSSFYLINTWITGIIILLILIATAFLGYVLPWGQISFWGATVITNLLRAIPYIGENITKWVWGGFSINRATLTRFFSLHFLLPFIILVFIIIHIIFLHSTGRNNPLGTSLNTDKIPFHPYFVWKDIFGFFFLIVIFTTLILIYPSYFRDPENFIPANPIITPTHIQPEWYFLFAYAILRSIPNKLGGVIALFLRITIFLTLPLRVKVKFSGTFIRPLKKTLFWALINIICLLTFLGACPVEAPYILTRQITTILYFSYFIILPTLNH